MLGAKLMFSLPSGSAKFTLFLQPLEFVQKRSLILLIFFKYVIGEKDVFLHATKTTHIENHGAKH